MPTGNVCPFRSSTRTQSSTPPAGSAWIQLPSAFFDAPSRFRAAPEAPVFYCRATHQSVGLYDEKSRLGRLSVIVLQQPTQSLLASNGPLTGRFRGSWPSKQQLIVFALMISLGVIMLLELG
jgi:hypothetical protein